MTNTKTVREVYPELPERDRELYRTIVSLSVLLLRSIQEQQDSPTDDMPVNEKTA